MRVLLALCFLFVCVYSAPTFDVQLDASWNLYKQNFEKKYKSFEEEIHRRSVWESNLDFIRKHNLEADLGLHSYTVGMNKYGDLSNAEFNKLMNTVKPRLSNQTRGSNHRTFKVPANFQRPDWIDWTQKGYVTGVKDQGQCGSCWAFSATGALEGQNFAKTGQLVSLSEQNLIDCSGQYGNQGCNGGRPDWSFHYVQDNGGIDTEDSYSYETQQDSCRYNPGNSGASDNGFVEIPGGDENALQEAIASVGPISVLIDASHQSFQLYQDGVYDEPACSQTDYDHAVLAVGYASKDGKDCYIVKNSWGSGWGTGGYILMSRNNNNQCAIAASACYPTV